MSILALQLTSDAERFTQTVSLDGSAYQLTFAWNNRAQSWNLDVAAGDGEPIASGLRVSVGWPLLRRCVHARRPPGELMAIDATGGGDPGRDDLGVRVTVHYIEAETVAALREEP